MSDAGNEHKLSSSEQREWERVKREESTADDWADLSRTLTSYRRRRIARHSKAVAGVDLAGGPDYTVYGCSCGFSTTVLEQMGEHAVRAHGWPGRLQKS